MLKGRISLSKFKFYRKLLLYASRSSNTHPMLLIKLLHEIRSKNVKNLTFFRNYCPLCDNTTIFIKSNDSEWGINCVKCLATPPIMSFIGVLKDVVGNELSRNTVYEMSTSGPLYKYLSKNAGTFYCSEYFENVKPGSMKYGAQCQDVQKLTFNNNSFNLITSTEVFEHVPNDMLGFSEILRTLKPDGLFLFIVPLHGNQTVERTLLKNGKLIHLLKPKYHGDPLRREGCLCFRNYGFDIVDRLAICGFKQTKIIKGKDYSGLGYRRYVIMAKKEM